VANEDMLDIDRAVKIMCYKRLNRLLFTLLLNKELKQRTSFIFQAFRSFLEKEEMHMCL
jgi:hypothetical protein